MPDPEKRGAVSRRKSVFWKVASAILVAQVMTGLIAISFSLYLSGDRSAELSESSIRERIDVLAHEIERLGAPLLNGLESLPEQVRLNLSLRFPDPVVLVDSEGSKIDIFYPSSDVFPDAVVDTVAGGRVPKSIASLLDDGSIVIDRTSDDLHGGWAFAPLFDDAGFLVGGFVIQPISATVAEELEPTRSAYRAAMVSVFLISLVVAMLFATGFTWWIIKPLRKIASKVEEIGAGDYTVRVDARSEDEIGRLGASVNQMAEQIAINVATLRTSDRLRRELVANVGHDLRTPLAAMKGYVEEGIRYYDEGKQDQARESLLSAQRQGNYLQRLVDDLFELSQVENPKPNLRKEPVPLAELLSDAARGHRPQIEGKGVQFEEKIQSGLPIIEADGVRLLRLLDNLLSNAIHFTDSGGRITLEGKHTENEIVVCVTDSGSGMSEDELALIFDRYYRGTSSRTRPEMQVGSGTGLGLAISRAVATSHGGTLTVTSQEGVGSTFTLTLPADLIQHDQTK